MQYKLTDEKLIEDGTIEDQIIEKHGFVPTFTINQLKDNLVINSKRIKELKGQIELDSAKMKNIESHHPFIKDMTDFDRRVVHMYEESLAMAKACQTKLDEFEKLAQGYGAELRLTRLRPSGRGVDVWDQLHPTLQQNRDLYKWLINRPNVLTGDSFFHLSALGDPLEGLNLCGAGRVVCLIDPVGNVYACPFVIHDEFLAGSIRDGGFAKVWTESELFRSLREPGNPGACGSCGSYDACRGGCMAAKFFTGLEMTDPDPECVFGHGETALAAKRVSIRPTPSPDHSRRTPVALTTR